MIEEAIIFKYFLIAFVLLCIISSAFIFIQTARKKPTDWAWIITIISVVAILMFLLGGIENEYRTITTELDTPHIKVFRTPYNAVVEVDKEKVYYILDAERAKMLDDTTGVRFYQIKQYNLYNTLISDTLYFSTKSLIEKVEN